MGSKLETGHIFMGVDGRRYFNVDVLFLIYAFSVKTSWNAINLNCVKIKTRLRAERATLFYYDTTPKIATRKKRLKKMYLGMLPTLNKSPKKLLTGKNDLEKANYEFYHPEKSPRKISPRKNSTRDKCVAALLIKVSCLIKLRTWSFTKALFPYNRNDSQRVARSCIFFCVN